ncbi:Uncharacterised protein [Enterobacter cloacae]|nr:Uncharacterised protein [Enterobacter cloacae]
MKKQLAFRCLTKTAITEKDGAVVWLKIEINGVNVHPDAGNLHLRFWMVVAKRSQHVEKPSHGQGAGCF